jgi:hypothetical protein
MYLPIFIVVITINFNMNTIHSLKKYKTSKRTGEVVLICPLPHMYNYSHISMVVPTDSLYCHVIE